MYSKGLRLPVSFHRADGPGDRKNCTCDARSGKGSTPANPTALHRYRSFHLKKGNSSCNMHPATYPHRVSVFVYYQGRRRNGCGVRIEQNPPRGRCCGGAVVQWLRIVDGLKRSTRRIASVTRSVTDCTLLSRTIELFPSHSLREGFVRSSAGIGLQLERSRVVRDFWNFDRSTGTRGFQPLIRAFPRSRSGYQFFLKRVSNATPPFWSRVTLNETRGDMLYWPIITWSCVVATFVENVTKRLPVTRC